MTLLAEPRPPAPAGPVRLVRRLWDAPLRAHVAGLAVLLLVLVPLIGTGSSFSADEGAAIIQARSLSRGDGWVVEHPAPEVDPTGAAYPLELSERGPKGVAPFVKHPLYALLLAGADRLAGVTGMVLLSVLGTVVAAGLAGLLAARIDPALARPAVWVTGVASPLLFDGYLVIAHTLGAAAAAGAVLVATIAFERRSRAPALAVVPCVAAAVLLRTEAAFLALGLAVAAVAVGARGPRLVAGIVATGSLLATVAARYGEAAWADHILGGRRVGTGQTNPIPTSGFLADRWDAFNLTWLRPGYDPPPLAALLLLVMLAAVLFGAYAARRDRPVAGRVAAVAGGAALVALVVAPENVVPGLLVTCPVILAGLVLMSRRTLDVPAARLAAVTAAVFAAGVLATQYTSGGSGEWGGHYFALALPIALPVLLAGIARRGSRALVGGLVACSLAMTVMAVGSLRATHRFSSGLVAAVDAAAGPGRPVLVSTSPLMPRQAWSAFDRQRWLRSRPADVASLVERVRAAGVERFTYVVRGDADLAALPSTVSTERSMSYKGWRIVVLRTEETAP